MEKNPSTIFLERWLYEHGLESLPEYSIRVTRDPRFPSLYCLKYGAGADKLSPIVRVCRGSVVELVENDGDHSPYFRVVAYAFDRFFNAGEPTAAEIDWGSARVYDKYDGSLIKLFYYEEQWVVSTSGHVGADVRFGDMPMTFEQLFWQVFDKVGYCREDLDPNRVYIFELCSTHNRVIVNHKVDSLPLLAVRSRSTMLEEELAHFGDRFRIARFWPLMRRIDDVEHNASMLKGSQHEGFIVVDKHFNRLKVKGASYVRMHALKNNGNFSFFQLWRDDDLVEFWTYFPEHKEELKKMLSRIEDAAFFVEGYVREYSGMGQKTFAEQVLRHHPKVSNAMFAIRSGKVLGFTDWLLQQSEATFKRIFEDE